MIVESERSAWWGRFHVLLWIMALGMLIHGVYFTVEHFRDSAYLRSEIISKFQPGDAEAALQQALSASFHLPPHRGPGNRPDYGLSHPAMRALGPPAQLIHQNGGHCGRRSRLMIALLDEVGIDARKVHLLNDRFAEFGHSHEYVHAVVEAQIGDQWVVADPLYNIVYRKADGSLAGLDDLRADQGLFLDAVQSADTRYSDYPVELYTYDRYRKFIWNSVPGGEQAFSLAEALVGQDSAEELHATWLFEQPLLATAMASYAAGLLLLGIALFVKGRSHRAPRLRAAPSPYQPGSTT